MARSGRPTAFSYRFDDVVVDSATFRVHKGDETRSLAPRAFDLLIYLIEHADRVVDKHELFEHVWGESFVSDNALTRAVKEIRQAIGDDADAPRYVQTVPKRGYRFIGQMEPLASAAEPPRDVAPHQSLKQPEILQEQSEAPGNGSERVKHELRVGEDIVRPGGKVSFYRSRSFALAMTFCLIVLGFVVWRNSRQVGPLEPTVLLRNEQITNWSGLDAFPAFSPDGNSIAYSSDHSGNFEIYVKSLVPGAREIQLTSDGQSNFQPAWSRDGQWIAYHSRNRGGIWTAAATGGSLRQVTEFGSYPAWSPDGTMIAFQSQGVGDLAATAVGPLPPSTLWMVNAKGGDPKRLTNIGSPPGGHGSPSWSRGGGLIAFVGYDGASCSMWTVSRDGARLTEVIKSAKWLYNPVFSPDDEYLYYGGVSEPSRFVLLKLRVSASTGEAIGVPQEVLDTGLIRIKQITISPDGKRIAYSAPVMTGNVFSVPLSVESGEATGAPVKLTQENSYRKGHPRFSPDGRKIAYVDFRGGLNQDILLLDLDRNETVQLITDPAVEWAPSWFPDGDRIAFQTDRMGRQTIWTTSIKSRRESLLLDPGQDFGWPIVSRDGKQIVFNSRKSGTTNVWMMGVEGGAPRQLTFDKESAGWASWSPDGQLLVFQLIRGDASHIAVMAAAGGAITQLTSASEPTQPSGWSPDGDKIAFSGFRNGYWNVYWVSRSTGEQRQLTNYKSLNSFVRYTEWSPLGDQIVYEYAETKSNIWMLELK